MKKLILTLLLTISLFAYEKGSSIDSDTVIKLQLTKNRIYIINFFASWCASCEKEMPLISQLNQTLDKNRYEIIGIDIDEKLSDAIEFQKKFNLNFRVINDDKNEIVAKFNPIAIPAIYFVKNNKVVEIIYGAKDDIDKKILEILKGVK